MFMSWPFDNLAEAQMEELYAIKLLRPKLNTYTASSLGRVGKRNFAKHNEAISSAQRKAAIDASARTCKGWETRSREGVSGWKHSDETRAKLSAVQSTKIGAANPFYGRKHTEATKAKIRASILGR